MKKIYPMDEDDNIYEAEVPDEEEYDEEDDDAFKHYHWEEFGENE